MVFALLRMEAAHPDAIVAAFPSDHFIDNDEAFITQTLDAVDAINSMPDKIAILGISPDRPETGYGYILPDRIVKSTGRASPVKAFVEKPSLPDAHRIISRGGLWNTFVMIFRLRRMLDLIGMLVPDEFDKISELRESPHRAAELYRTLNSWNLSTRVLARIPQHLIMLKVTDVHWNDWGTRESIEHTYRRLDRVPFWSMSRQPANPATRSRNMIRARADSKEAADGLSVA
jgi:mannose-1-phosphate guanylyltransferase